MVVQKRAQVNMFQVREQVSKGLGLMIYASTEPFPFSLYDLLEQCLPLYNMRRRYVRRTSTLLKSPLPPHDLPVLANEKLFAWVGDEILPCESAKVSVFDLVVQGGDSVWEGLLSLQ